LNSTPSRHSSDRSLLDEESGVDVRRYLAALRRSRGLMIGIVVLVTGAALALSLLLPKTYEARATIALDVEVGALGVEDPDSVARRLETLNALLLTTDVLDRAAEEVPGETADSLGPVESTVDAAANLIYITVENGDPQKAAAIANAIAQAFLTVQTERDQERFDAAAQSVREQIAELERDPGAADQVALLRQRVTDFEVQSANAGADLFIAERASAPSQPASPRPLRNTVLAFFASFFLAVLVALGRDQLRPRISEPRELSQALDTPVLAGIPFVGRRFGRRNHMGAAVEHEAYQTLRAAVELAAPPDTKQLILVASALHGEGKTTVTARLGRAFAQAGHKTLLISADLRWPDLHEVFDLPVEPGLSDVLRLTERAGVSESLLSATAHEVVVRGAGGSEQRLDVLTSGRKLSDPARLLSSPAARSFFEYVRGFEYDYVLIDAPPMLGIADAQGLARETDSVLIVSRLERLSADNVIDLRDVMERVSMNPLGLVVIGARVEDSPYYLSQRRSLFRGAPEEAAGTGAGFTTR
jgi:capsular exopolysaccharide synthesis family protein